MSDIEQKILGLFKTYMDIEDPNVEQDLIEIGMDSLDVVEMVMHVEDEFMICIRDDAIEDMKTIGDIVNYVKDEKNEQHTGI